MTIQELFTRKAPPVEPRPPLSVCELLALELGWPEPIALHFAAHEAGIRASTGWTERTIDHLCFLRATAPRWH